MFTVDVGGCSPMDALVHIIRCADDKNYWSVKNSCGYPLTCDPQAQASQQSEQMGGQHTALERQNMEDG